MTNVANESHLETIDWGLSPERADGNYSDSEEEDAPHFQGVHNQTKMFIQNKAPEKEVCINNYALRPEEVIPNQLKADAEAIHHVIPQTDRKGSANREYGATTVLCVALQDKCNRVKKFVFSNCKGIMGTTLRAKAYELGYHAVQAQQAHAEGEFLQFLQERSTTYTHTIALGCDKDHCTECNWALEAKLAGAYLTVSGNVESTKRFSKWYIPPAQEASLGQMHTPYSKESERQKRHTNGSWDIEKFARQTTDAWKQSKRRKRFLARKTRRKENQKPYEDTARDKSVCCHCACASTTVVSTVHY